MKELEFEIPGKLQAKQRPRFVRQTGRTYTPTETINAEVFIREFFCSKFPEHEIFQGPVLVCIELYRQAPTSWPKWKQNYAKEGLYYDAFGSDLDNKAKTILDALNGIAYKDDKQVISLMIKKSFIDRDYTHVSIREYTQPDRPWNNVIRANSINGARKRGIPQRGASGRGPAADRMKRSGGVY